MLKQWTERVPPLRGDLMALREISASDVYTLFTLFSDSAVTQYMAPPPPTLAKFAGFVAWSHQEREQGRGLCFGIVPDGMTAAVGILQVRTLDPTLSSAEWGFVLSAHFWSTGVFFDAANVFVEFAFTTMHVDRLEARIALREAGASKYETKEENRKNLRRTKARERRGATEDRWSARHDETRAELYQEARRQNIPGRSKMSKRELERALH